MLKNLIVPGVAVAAITLASAPAHALKIQKLDFAEKTGEHEIHVAYDKAKKNWTTATSKPTAFKLDWHLKVRSLQPIKDGTYVALKVLGTPNAYHIYWLEETRDNPGVVTSDLGWKGLKTFNIPGNKLLLSSTAVERCQKLHTLGKRPNKSHRVYIGQIASRLETLVQNYSNLAFAKSAKRTVMSDVYAVCKQDPTWNTPTSVSFDHGAFKVKDIKLFLTTYSAAVSRPNPGATCKKARVLVRLKASKAGNARFKLWLKVGNKPMASKVVDAWASHDGNGGYVAEHVEWVSVSKTTYMQARAEELVSGFGMSTAWEDLTLHCQSAGGGGLTSQTPDAPEAPKLKLTGDFAFIDRGAPKCVRQGKALITFRSNRPGNVHYSLDCTNGKSFSGVAQAAPHPQGGYVAVALKKFKIAKSTVYSCALKTSAPGPAKLHKWKSHKYNCVKPAVETGSNDLKPASRPGQSATRVPAKIKKIVPNRAEVERKRREAAKKAAAERKRKEAIKKRREAAKKAAADKRRREAARKRAQQARKKAAEARRRAAAQRAQEARRKRQAATQAAAAARKARSSGRRRSAVR